MLIWSFCLIVQLPLTHLFPVQNNVCKTFFDYATITTNKNCSYNVDVDLSPSQIVQIHGFVFESHKVKTEDGYILGLFHILDNKNDQLPRQPVVLQHGIISSAATWLLQGENSLAFFLVNNGYDVWLANFRGSKYSSEYENADITERQYWNFSFHEVGVYDLPAYIEYISNITEKGNRDIIYIGQSMGTTVAFVYASLKEKHAERYLNKIIALAPVACIGHVKGFLPVLAPYVDLIKTILENWGVFAVGQHYDLQKALSNSICDTYPLILICQILMSFFAGLSLEQVKPEVLPLIVNNLPTGTSLKTLAHYGQIILAKGRFQLYDYGRAENMRLYNNSVPPEYPLERISIPTHLFVGEKDFIADYEDAESLYEKLTCNKSLHSFEMAHNDFFFGRRVDAFYRTLLEVMKI